MESLRLSDITIRTFGWIQNPSDFSKLKKIVQLFDHTSSIHVDLKENRIPRLVEKDDGRDRFIEILNRIPLKIKYIDLVGTSFKPRSSGRCNGIAQAMIEVKVRVLLIIGQLMGLLGGLMHLALYNMII